MTLDYMILLAAVGVPMGMLTVRMVGMIALMFETSAGLWMLPL